MYIISININAQPNIDYSRDITTCHNKPNNWIRKSVDMLIVVALSLL
jgi:hypothetical protein